MVEKDIAELHFDHQVWTDPVLPDRREHHRICNADGILPIAADGVVWTGNHCFFDFWIRDSIRGSSLCYRLSDKECSFCLWEDNKFFSSKKKKLTKRIAKELLDKGWCRVTGLYTPKKPQLYDAVIRLDDSGGKYVSFKMEFDR